MRADWERGLSEHKWGEREAQGSPSLRPQPPAPHPVVEAPPTPPARFRAWADRAGPGHTLLSSRPWGMLRYSDGH